MAKEKRPRKGGGPGKPFSGRAGRSGGDQRGQRAPFRGEPRDGVQSRGRRSDEGDHRPPRPPRGERGGEGAERPHRAPRFAGKSERDSGGRPPDRDAKNGKRFDRARPAQRYDGKTDVESGGRPFRGDGPRPRRFEARDSSDRPPGRSARSGDFERGRGDERPHRQPRSENTRGGPRRFDDAREKPSRSDDGGREDAARGPYGARPDRAPRTSQFRDDDRSRGRDGYESRRFDGPRKPQPGAEQRIVGREKARRAQSLGDDGALWLYGKHSVAAALANPKRKVKRLLAADGAQIWLASIGIPKERIDVVEESTTDEIGLILHQGAVHQGLAALVEDLPRARLREECAPDESGGPVVVLDQITDPQNIGAIMRSASAFGARAVIVQDRRTPPLAGALAKAAAGAVEQIPCVKVVNVARAVEGLKDLGYFCAGLAGEAGAPISDIPKGRPVALVFGAEGEGLRRLVAETCDGLYRIPIANTVESLNVSTAAAVSLYAVTR